MNQSNLLLTGMRFEMDKLNLLKQRILFDLKMIEDIESIYTDGMKEALFKILNDIKEIDKDDSNC